MSNENIARWSKRLDLPLMIAAGAFLVAYAIPILEPAAPADVLNVCQVVTWVTWALFTIDLAVRVAMSNRRANYLARHWLDVVILTLPLLRPLRLLRLVTLLGVVNRRAGSRLRGRIAVYVAGGSALLAFCAALAVLDAERGSPDANITTFEDAMWWAITTMTTVGYGDQFPVTATGRIVGVALMVGGIALLGVVTATLASWLLDAVRAEQAVGQDETEDLRAEIRELHAKVDQLLDRAA